MLNILITGAGTGVGKETAKAFAKQYEAALRIFLVGRNLSRLEQVSGAIKNINQHCEVHCIAADLTSQKGIDSIFSEVNKHTASLEILINNAGLLIKAPATELTLENYLSVYSTNVFGPALLTGKLFSHLSNGKLHSTELRAHVINISSMGGIQGSSKFPGLSAYSSSKGAIITLTECLAEEWKQEKIHVNVLAIGSVETEMFSNAFPGVQAATTSPLMGSFIAEFALKAGNLMNGKIVPVSSGTP